MAQSHKRLSKKPNFSNGKKWSAMMKNNQKIINS